MKTVIVETKHGGQVTVPVYDSIEEVIAKTSKELVLKNINRIVRIDVVNESNRQMSLTARLKKAVKLGQVDEAVLEDLLKRAA